MAIVIWTKKQIKNGRATFCFQPRIHTTSRHKYEIWNKNMRKKIYMASLVTRQSLRWPWLGPVPPLLRHSYWHCCPCRRVICHASPPEFWEKFFPKIILGKKNNQILLCGRIFFLLGAELLLLNDTIDVVICIHHRAAIRCICTHASVSARSAEKHHCRYSQQRAAG